MIKKAHAEEAIKAVSDIIRRDKGLRGPEALRAVANALFMLCRSFEEWDEKEWTSTMAFLSGMATGLMMDTANKLEGKK